MTPKARLLAQGVWLAIALQTFVARAGAAGGSAALQVSLAAVSQADANSGSLPPSSRFSPEAPPPAEPPAASRFSGPQDNDDVLRRLTSQGKDRAAAYLRNGRDDLRRNKTLSAVDWYRRAQAIGATFQPGEYSPQQLAAELRAKGVKEELLARPAAAAANSRVAGGQPAPRSRDAADSSAERKKLLHDARLALAHNDLRSAHRFLGRLKELGGAYPPLGDSPQKIEDLLRQHQRFAAGPRGANPTTFARAHARFLMAQAEGLMRYREYRAAEKVAQEAHQLRVAWRPFERSPLQLLDELARLKKPHGNDRVAGPPATHLAADKPRGGDPASRFAEPAGLPDRGPKSPQESRRSQVLSLVASARAALDRGDLNRAEQMAAHAEQIDGAESALRPGDPRPWEVLTAVKAERSRLASQVARTGGAQAFGREDAQPGKNVSRAVFDPRRDSTSNQPAAQLEAPSVVRPPASAEAAEPSAQAAGDGQKLVDEGERAFLDRDHAKALMLFKQAWKFRNELDPTTQQRLQDRLQFLSRVQAPRRSPTATPLEDIDSKQRIAVRQLLGEVSRTRRAAEAESRKDPKAALAKLQELRGRVLDAEVPEATRRSVLAGVDRNIKDLRVYIKRFEPLIEADARNRRVKSDIVREQELKLKNQQRLADMVEQFNQLLDEQRWAEAEVLARKAKELAPGDPVTTLLTEKAKFVHRFRQQMAIKEAREKGIYETLTDVERSANSMPTGEPLIFPEAQQWQQLSANRRKRLRESRNHMTPEELRIHEALRKQVEVNFKDRPLSEVVDTLQRVAGINVFLDPQGLSAEGVSSDTPVTINLREPISLRSALNLILEQYGLDYVVQNEVLKITTARAREGEVYTRVYNVADLVIPIPNFVPSYNMGLPGALREAYNASGHGLTGGAVHQSPLTIAQQQPGASPSASVLANLANGAGSLGKGSRANQPLGFGPGGVSGGSGPDFDTLIQLITQTVAPRSWDEVGGPGTIREFPANLTIVVSNRQEVHEDIIDLLDQLRRLQDLQVTIEVRFIRLNDNFFERIGVDFDFDIDDNVTALPPDDSGPSVTVGLDPSGAPTMDLDLSFTQGGFASAIPSFGGFDAATAANFGFAILSDIEAFFVIQAAQGDDRTNVMQAPKVTLFNGQQAFVSDTTQMPFVTSVIPVVGDFAAAHQPVIVVLTEGTSLSVQAVVSEDRRFVRLTLVPFFSKIGDVDEFTFEGKTTTSTGTATVDPTDPDSTIADDAETTTEGTTIQLPTFSFTTVTTTVSVPDGGTILLGGIKRLSEGRTERGVPILSKLPYINRLFKNVGIGRTTESLMMMVTPRIIIQEEEEEKLGIDFGS